MLDEDEHLDETMINRSKEMVLEDRKLTLSTLVASVLPGEVGVAGNGGNTAAVGVGEEMVRELDSGHLDGIPSTDDLVASQRCFRATRPRSGRPQSPAIVGEPWARV